MGLRNGKPFFRAELVGSLLRPQHLLDARDRFARGGMTRGALWEIENGAIAEAVKLRLMRLAGSRMTKDGVLVIRAERHRTQEMNRADARERLGDMVREALVEPKPRVKTKPTRASKERRVEGKKHRSTVKKQRQTRGWDD